jgi:hypothetical protein
MGCSKWLNLAFLAMSITARRAQRQLREPFRSWNYERCRTVCNQDAILPWLPLERVTTGSSGWRNFAISCSTFDPDCSAAEPGSIEMFDKDFQLSSIVSNFGKRPAYPRG